MRENRKNAHLGGDMAHPPGAPASGNSGSGAEGPQRGRTLPAALPNYFTGAEVAARYSKVRPFFHEEAVRCIRAFAGIERFHNVLDVGCGTGQSSIALASVADRVIAIDSSQEMLNLAPSRPNVVYQLGFAEQLNFAAGQFDLISASSALHWFDPESFFPQCHNVLTTEGLLAVYNDDFTTHMQDAAACKLWMRSRFAKRFPSPRHGMRDIDERKATDGGFAVAHRSSFTHLVPFSREEFAAYLLTRSNTLAAIQSGAQTELSAAEWLGRELKAILPDGVDGNFLFKCNLWLLRKAALPACQLR